MNKTKRQNRNQIVDGNYNNKSIGFDAPFLRKDFNQQLQTGTQQFQTNQLAGQMMMMTAGNSQMDQHSSIK